MTNKSQTSNLNDRNLPLGFIWDLDIGIWDLFKITFNSLKSGG